MNEFASVIVDISHEKVDRPFCYKVPPQMREILKPGMRVRIPFGQGNRPRTGYVIELTDESDYPMERLKEIEAVLEDADVPQQRLIALAAWMKEQYGSTMIAALKTVLPARQRVKQKETVQIRLAVSGDRAGALLAQYGQKHWTARERLLRELVREEVLPRELVLQKLHIPAATIRWMEQQGVLIQDSRPCYRNPVKAVLQTGEQKNLSPAQQAVADSVLSAYDQGQRRPVLLHGITGSGKTEVYLALIEGMIKRGKQAIVLIPEIALTYQTVMRFYRRFGDRVSVMNSSLSVGEKQDQCERARTEYQG